MSLETLQTRLNYDGGDQLGRIKKQKLNSFHAALERDYNSRVAKLEDGTTWKCLINDDNTKSDYDKRYFSIDFDSGVEPGDTFETIDDNVHWMVYLPDLVEIAYFKSEIIRCRYQCHINDTDYWVYFQGPTETDIRWNIKDSINWNDLNLSGTLYIKNNEETKEYFSRFSTIELDEHMWEVQVVDSITVPGIIELELQEYHDSLTDDLVSVIKDDTDEIIGKSEVAAGEIVGYQINDDNFGEDSWTISDNDDVEIKEYQANGQTCVITIGDNATGTFTISYGDITKEITIAAMQYNISGPTEVYPYGIYNYTIDSIDEGQFSIAGSGATITAQTSINCTVEITTGKKGSFSLIYSSNSINETYPIKILSL